MNESTTTPPSTPAAPLRSIPLQQSSFSNAILISIFFTMFSSVGAIIGIMVAAYVTHNELEESRAWTKAQVIEMQKIADHIMVPPTNDKLFSILSQGIGVTEDAVRTTNVGTTPDAAFATDLTTSQQSNAYTQEVVIQNTHATQNLCVSPIAWSSVGATCALKCAAATATCSGAATDGVRIGAGSEREFRYDGTSCICVEGSGASTTYQSERVLR